MACVLGVLLGDGWVDGRDYRIALSVKDYEFALAFSHALAIGLNKPVKQPKQLSNGSWRVVYKSKAFYEWYRSLLQRGDLTNLKEYVEYDRETVRAFLLGLFDAEGGYTYRRDRGKKLFT
ncbi:hypothetical protein B6U99_04450 [Candidatus Geothermarchaeota archaeon ex4572_27]|nr:MAG: hypothetical protein B6U99_04450 [Candidatus Geothermarchaeota archaeon ex4572_27]